MIIHLQETDLELVLDFKLRKLGASGSCRVPADWRQRSLESYRALYRDGKCRHLAFRADDQVVALAGAFVCEEAPFLSTKTARHGLIVDEYVLPEYRNRGIGPQLQQELLAWLTAKGASLNSVISANQARLACAAGNHRL